MDAEKSVSIAGPQGGSGDEVIQIAIRLPHNHFSDVGGHLRQCAQTSVDGPRSVDPRTGYFCWRLGWNACPGILGLFVGPIILAVAWELLTAWKSGTAEQIAPLT
jgi:hypothetical protein